MTHKRSPTPVSWYVKTYLASWALGTVLLSLLLTR
jgi:hypothetical protein